MDNDTLARFWARAGKGAIAGACWWWVGARNKRGQGVLTIRGSHGYPVKVIAARLSWEIAFGAIPSGWIMLPLCFNPACVNPDHLAIGRQRDLQARLKLRRSVGQAG